MTMEMEMENEKRWGLMFMVWSVGRVYVMVKIMGIEIYVEMGMATANGYDMGVYFRHSGWMSYLCIYFGGFNEL